MSWFAHADAFNLQMTHAYVKNKGGSPQITVVILSVIEEKIFWYNIHSFSIFFNH